MGIYFEYVVARLKLWKRIDGSTNNEFPTRECQHIPIDSPFVPYLCKLTGELIINLADYHDIMDCIDKSL
jgi:hypothetical protein